MPLCPRVPSTLAILVLAGCSGGSLAQPGTDTGADATGADAAAPACAPASSRPDGTCCPAGHLFLEASGGCASVGPRGCAITTAPEAQACEPSWCGGVATLDGAPCEAGEPACLPAAVTCPDDAAPDPGCPAGSWPDSPGNCLPAGPAEGLDGAFPAGAGAALPALPPIAAPSDPRWCLGAGGEPVSCPAGQAGCLPGEWPDPDAPGACAPAGVPWVCPPGFVPSKTRLAVVDGLPPCDPDPADCGAGPYAPGVPIDGTVFVDASASPGGDGTPGKPLATVAAALAKVPAAGVVALAAGEYVGTVTLTKAVTLRGRCAAMSRLSSPGAGGVVAVKGGSAAPLCQIVGLEIGGGSPGVLVNGKAHVVAKRLWIRAASTAGLGVIVPGATAEVRESVIADTQGAPSGGNMGRGIDVSGGGTATIVDVRLSGNRDIGLLVAGAGAAVKAERLVIDDTQPQVADAIHGRGLEVNGGASLELARARVARSREVGLRVAGAGTTALVSGIVVEGTLPLASSKSDGGGVIALKGGSLTLRGAVIRDSRAYGVTVFDNGAKVDIAGLRVVDTDIEQSSGDLGQGVRVGAKASASLVGSRISGSHLSGIAASGGGAGVALDGVVVEGTAPIPSLQLGGHGVLVLDGAVASASHLHLSDNHEAGLGVAGEGTFVSVADLVVDRTHETQAAGSAAIGVAVQAGAHLQLEGARVNRTAGFGVSVGGAGTLAELRSLVVDETQPVAGVVNTGMGIGISDESTAIVRKVRLSRNVVAGMLLGVAGTRADVRDLVVDETGPSPSTQAGGVGCGAGGGAWLFVQGARIVSNHQVGIEAFGAGTRVRAIGVQIEDTRVPPGEPNGGLGVQSSEGAFVQIVGSRVTTSRTEGLLVGLGGARIEATGLRVYGTLVDINGSNGLGVVALGGGSLDMKACKITDNYVAGIGVFGGSVTVADTVVTGTKVAQIDRAKPGTEKLLGDGLVAIGAVSVSIERAVFAANPRAGVLLDATKQVALSRVLSLGNGYGIVSQAGPAPGESLDAIFGNTMQQRVVDAGFQVPPAPSAIPPSSAK